MPPCSTLEGELHPFGVADGRTSLSPKLQQLVPLAQFGVDYERPDSLDELSMAEDLDELSG